MFRLQRITDELYMYKDTRTGLIFTLKIGARGVYGNGRAFYLSYGDYNTSNTIATLCVKDDGYRCFTTDYEGKLWTSGLAMLECEKLIDKMLEIL